MLHLDLDGDHHRLLLLLRVDGATGRAARAQPHVERHHRPQPDALPRAPQPQAALPRRQPPPGPHPRQPSAATMRHRRLSGQIPASLAVVPHLTSLLLDHNLLTGAVPLLPQCTLCLLNVSANRLFGRIPPALGTRFDASSFSPQCRTDAAAAGVLELAWSVFAEEFYNEVTGHEGARERKMERWRATRPRQSCRAEKSGYRARKNSDYDADSVGTKFSSVLESVGDAQATLKHL
ncbi:hypothetical protein ACP70R_042556 [Stipagrostis hirtigluma subsp. patula]